MVGIALQEQLLQGRTGSVLEAINNAEALIGRQKISFPRIAVFGDESTGKSSVLESICKIPFPRGKTTTTRCPTQVRLHRKPGATWSATAWTGGLDGEDRMNERHVTSPAEITKHISELQTIEVDAANKRSSMRGGAKFSHIPITISVEADDVVDLTLVDLPGFFTHDTLEGGQGQSDDIERIKHTLLDYLCDPHTILLVIVPCNVLVKTANIIDLVKGQEGDLSRGDPTELMKFRARTIYCFTKCDTVFNNRGLNSPNDVEEMLCNEGNFASKPHGWFAVVNNGSETSDTDFLGRLTKDREFENKFFSDHYPFNRADLRSRCGMNNLVEMLSSLLSEEISQQVPTMLSQTGSELARANMELKALGRPPLEAENLSVAFNKIVSDIKRYYHEAGEGTYYNMFSEVEDSVLVLPEGALESIKLGNLRGMRCDQFQKEMDMHSLTSHLDGQTEPADILKMVREARSGKFEATMANPEVLCEVVRKCAKTWKKLGASLCDDIAEHAKTCLDILVDIKAGKYERLPIVLKEHLGEMIEEQRAKAQNRLAWLYLDEHFRPDTQNERFMKEFKKEKNVPGLGPDKQAVRDTFISNLRAYLPVAEARYIDGAIRTVTTHILDVPQGTMPEGDRLTSVPWEGDPKYVFEAMQIADGQDLKELMKVRDELANRRAFVQKKVDALKELKESLRQQPAAKNYGAEEGTTAPAQVMHSPQAATQLFSNGSMGSSDGL